MAAVSTPRRVIRFYGDPKYALESIGFKEITFLHADKLNDPFDPPFYFITDFNKDYEELTKYIQQHHSKDLKRFSDRLSRESWDAFLSSIEKYFYDCRNNSFIFSTCGVDNKEHPKDSLYMWSHYGNGHRGVAIEFDTHLLTRAVSKNLATHGTEPLYKIGYRTDMPKITCESIYQYIMNVTKNDNDESWDETELFNTFCLILSSKSRVWEDEKEWRYILRNDKTRLKVLKLGLDDDTITTLYIGCRTDYRVKDDLIFEIRNKFPNATVYKSNVVEGNFALAFEPLL